MKDLSVYPIINNRETSLKLKALRQAHDLSVGDVQSALGISQQAVYCWENMEMSNIPSIDNLLGLSMLYNTSIDNMLVLNFVATKTEYANYVAHLNELSKYLSTNELRKIAARHEYYWNINELKMLGASHNHLNINQ